MVRVLFLGEITGRPGITCIKNGLPALKKKYDIDYTIANGEGMTGGFGIGRAHAAQLTKMGVDLITGAEKPGRSYRSIEIKGHKFIIINLQGNALFPRQSIQNAFSSIDMLLKKLEEKEPGAIILLQFHAATTAEKKTMRFFLDGRAAAVIGTHTKVITADEMVSSSGLAYITDNGRVGSFMSVGGFDPSTEIKKLRSQLPVRSQECWNDGIIEGVLVDIDEESGKSVGIHRIMEHVEITAPGNANEADSDNPGK